MVVRRVGVVIRYRFSECCLYEIKRIVKMKLRLINMIISIISPLQTSFKIQNWQSDKNLMNIFKKSDKKSNTIYSK